MAYEDLVETTGPRMTAQLARALHNIVDTDRVVTIRALRQAAAESTMPSMRPLYAGLALELELRVMTEDQAGRGVEDGIRIDKDADAAKFGDTEPAAPTGPGLVIDPDGDGQVTGE